MKKAICIFVSSVILLLCLSSCATKANSMKVIVDGQEHTPSSNWIFSLSKDGVAADGARMQPKDAADESTAIPLKDTISVLIEGETTGAPYYTLYKLSDNFEEIYYRSDRFEAPADNGTFLCIAEVTWGNEDQYEGYQYFFKFTK